MKRLLIIIFLLASTLTKGQTTFIGFDTTICSSLTSNTYTYSNWTSGTGGSYNGGVNIFKNGIQVSSFHGSLGDTPHCVDMIFINDSVGFIVVLETMYRSKLYKTSNYGQSWTQIGQHSPLYFGAYVVNENYVYLVTQLGASNNTVWAIKCSDIQPQEELIIDDTLNAPIYINDTILNNSLCNIDSLKIFIKNNSDTITYHINFTFLSTGIAIHDSTINTIKLFPNPTSNQLNIEYGKLQIERINILDITGKTIKTITKKTNTVNVSDLQNGIYFIQLITDEKTITQKFVKQ